MDAVNAGPIRQIGFHCSEHGLVMVKPDDGLPRVPWVCSRVTLFSPRVGGPQICGKTLDSQVQAESTSCATCGHEPHAEKGCCLANLGIRVCSCRAGREGDSQPMPVPNDAPSVQSQVIADIEKWIELGIERYGTALQPFNGRDMLQDLYEELLDACVYIKGEIIERESKEARMAALVRTDLSHSGQRVTMAPPEPKNRSGKPTAPLTGAPRADAP